MRVAAVILTFNEARHLARCLDSLRGVVTETVVADCFSTDATIEIAEARNARVIRREWTNHATQFNWAITQIAPAVDWVLRIDADEYLSPQLASEIRTRLEALGPQVDGVYCNRRIVFQGQLVRHGGVGVVPILRIFRNGRGRCESRWMDEHIKVDGETVAFHGDIIDENLNSLTWWTAKHNGYSSREAVDLLNLEFGFMTHDSIANLRDGQSPEARRWMKEKVYARLPGGLRALAYFLYRYFVRFGFMDGRSGTVFHVLQGFWYRYLVDAKLREVRRYIKDKDVDVVTAIKDVLAIDVRGKS